MEHQPVTTNPFIIMLINMTVVFIVLFVLMYVIKLIHYVDPTKPKEETKEVAPVKAAPTVAPAPTLALGRRIALFPVYPTRRLPLLRRLLRRRA